MKSSIVRSGLLLIACAMAVGLASCGPEPVVPTPTAGKSGASPAAAPGAQVPPGAGQKTGN